MAKSAAPKKAPAARKEPRPAAPRQSAPNADAVLDQLDTFSVSSLRAIAEKAQALVKEKADSERQALIEDVKSRAKGLGVSVRDLFGLKEGKAPKKAGAKRGAVPVKYQGPNPQDQWSGRGRQPTWLRVLEAEGRNREEFLVDKG